MILLHILLALSFVFFVIGVRRRLRNIELDMKCKLNNDLMAISMMFDNFAKRSKEWQDNMLKVSAENVERYKKGRKP